MRRWISTILVLVLLGVIGAIVFRAAFYLHQIQTGELAVEDSRFASSRSISQALLAQPLPVGKFDVFSADDPLLGSKDASVTVVEFVDFGCSYSRTSGFVLRTLAAEYGDRVRFQVRDFPLTELHPQAVKAAEAADCAQEQGKYWEYHDKLYQNQADQSVDALIGYARELNLDTSAFRLCLNSGRHAPEVSEDYDAGVLSGVTGTPTFFINGNRIPGAIPEDVFRSLIDRLLTAK